MCTFIYNQDSVESDYILQVITLGLEGQHIDSLLYTVGIIIILKTLIKTEKKMVHLKATFVTLPIKYMSIFMVYSIPYLKMRIFLDR